jgi:hypothetical protein
MHAYFDESGTFQPVPKGSLDFSYVVGIVIPEGSVDSLKSAFDRFESHLTSAEKKDGEPKGARLSRRSCDVLLEIMKSHRDVILIPITVNIGANSPDFMESAPKEISKVIEGNLGEESSYMPVARRKELAKQVANLSAPALFRILAYAIAVQRTVEAITLHYACDKFRRDYDPISITFDRVTKAKGREQIVFENSVFGYITNWSASVPLRTHPSVTLEHPLGALYGNQVDGKIALSLPKMLAGRIDFADSKKVWQVRLADFLAGIWSRAIDDYSGATGMQSLFSEFHRKTILLGGQRVGVVTLTGVTASTGPAPLELNVFAEMVDDNSKILPCT